MMRFLRTRFGAESKQTKRKSSGQPKPGQGRVSLAS